MDHSVKARTISEGVQAAIAPSKKACMLLMVLQPPATGMVPPPHCTRFAAPADPEKSRQMAHIHKIRSMAINCCSAERGSQ